jgi:hypothetical protein
VGLFAHWVCVKGPAHTLREAGFGQVVEAGTPGWSAGYPEEGALPPELDAFDELVAGVALSAGGPALGSWIHDSDVGYLAAADEHGGVTHLVVNPEAGEAYDVPLPEGWPDGAIARFAEWSNDAPNALDSTAIAEVVGRDWTFAEEGVRELHERLGLAVPFEAEPDATIATPMPRATVDAIDARGLGGYEAPLPWMTEMFLHGMRSTPWRTARHVPGVGADFIGIWDRDSPEAPIASFPISKQGEAQAMQELLRLQASLMRSDVGGDQLAGFERTFFGEQTVRLIQRELPWKDARYVAGYGSAFIGVWDRERPDAPIEQLASDNAGLKQAYETVGRLLFEDVLVRKELPGVRLFLPRVEARVVQQEVAPEFLERIHELGPEVRAAWEEQMEGGGPWIRSPSGPWLLTEEDEDEAWPPTLSGTGRFYLYGAGMTGTEDEDELYLMCQGNFPTEEGAREMATRRYAQGEWREVPEDVPRNLLDTVRWVLAHE